MKQAYVVTNGTVINTIMLEDDANPANFGAMLGPADAAIGWTFNGSEWSAPKTAEAPGRSIEDLRDAAKATIDADAEAYRLRFITAGSGQAMAYTQKLDEARAYLADPSLTAAECPHIFAEVGITGETAQAVAQIVVGMHGAWQTKSAGIERKRLATKAAIDAADTPEAINAAAKVNWAA